MAVFHAGSGGDCGGGPANGGGGGVARKANGMELTGGGSWRGTEAGCICGGVVGRGGGFGGKDWGKTFASTDGEVVPFM